MSNGGLLVHKRILAKCGAAGHYGGRLLPGLFFCSVIVLACVYLSERYGSPLILGALLLGMGFNSVNKYPEFSPGIGFCAQRLLRFGVTLLGARISFAQIGELGYRPVVLVVVVVIATLAFGLLLARLFKIDPIRGAISAAAVAICGASAALAVAAALQATGGKNPGQVERHLLGTLVGVTGLSTLVMVLYPGLLMTMGLSPEQMGLFLGASIHDVAQVLGAGQLISTDVTELATYTKMLRVTLLVPAIMILAWLFRAPETTRRGPFSVCPPFILGFVLLMLAANLQLLPTALIDFMADVSKASLLLAIAALGTKTNLLEMWQLGCKPFALLILNTVFIAAVALIMVL